MLKYRVLRSALPAAVLAIACACAQPVEKAPPADAPAPAGSAASPASDPPPPVRVPADAPPEPAAGPREPLQIVTGQGTVSLQVELAETEAQRGRGLMFRRSMAPDHGMLFDFQEARPVFFWMRNTYIPLDMIFINADGTIAAIAANTIPLSEAPVGPGAPVRAVLELNAGRAAALGIRAGDRVDHRIFGG